MGCSRRCFPAASSTRFRSNAATLNRSAGDSAAAAASPKADRQNSRRQIIALAFNPSLILSTAIKNVIEGNFSAQRIALLAGVDQLLSMALGSLIVFTKFFLSRRIGGL